jgi:hypothetical protein
MARKNTPHITHTEIYALAIRAIDAEIATWRESLSSITSGDAIETSLRNICAPHFAKREMLCQLYKLERGADYDL